MLIALIIVSVFLVLMIGIWIYTMYRWVKEEEELRNTISDLQRYRFERDTLKQEIQRLTRIQNDLQKLSQEYTEHVTVHLLLNRLYWLWLNGKTNKDTDIIIKHWRKLTVTNDPGLIQERKSWKNL